MRISLELVVIAIVILVVALVMLTIFSQGMLQLGPITTAKNNCNRIAVSTCSATGTVPSTWTTDRVGPNGETCAALLPGCMCIDNQWPC